MRRKERGKVGFCAHRQSIYSLHWGLESAAGKARGFPARAQCLTLDGWDQLTPIFSVTERLEVKLKDGRSSENWNIPKMLPRSPLWQHSELIVSF